MWCVLLTFRVWTLSHVLVGGADSGPIFFLDFHLVEVILCNIVTSAFEKAKQWAKALGL